MFPSTLNYQQANSVTQVSIVKSYLWTCDIISNLSLQILADNLRLVLVLYFLRFCIFKTWQMWYPFALHSVKMQLFFPGYVYAWSVSSARVQSEDSNQICWKGQLTILWKCQIFMTMNFQNMNFIFKEGKIHSSQLSLPFLLLLFFSGAHHMKNSLAVLFLNIYDSILYNLV